MDIYGFYTGKIFNAYEYMGAHVQSKELCSAPMLPTLRQFL